LLGECRNAMGVPKMKNDEKIIDLLIPPLKFNTVSESDNRIRILSE